MARILVTGAAGFLGSHLVDRLLSDGHEVVGVDSMLGGDPRNVCKHKKYAFHGDDVSNIFGNKFIFQIHNSIDIVYHCAAAPHEGLSVFSPVVVNQNTYMSTVATATAAIAAGVKRFVFMSSMSRYGKGENLPFRESDRPHPTDPYGISKVASEDFLRMMGRTHGMEVVVLVPHNIIGHRQKYNDPFRNVASIMANLMLQGRQPIIYGDGKQQRVFSHVADCIDPMVKTGFQEGLDGEIINIGPDDNPITINNLAFFLAEIIGFKNLDPIYYPDRPCEVKDAWPSSDKARKLLGYETKTSLVDSLRSIVDWIRKWGWKQFEYHLPIEIVSEKTPKTWKDRVF